MGVLQLEEYRYSAQRTHIPGATKIGSYWAPADAEKPKMIKRIRVVNM